MAFSPTSLIRVTQAPVGAVAGTPKANQAGLFHYSIDDTAAVVEAAGYFNNARNQLTVGSIILAAMALAGTPVTKQYVVLTVPATGNVTIGLQTTTAG